MSNLTNIHYNWKTISLPFHCHETHNEKIKMQQLCSLEQFYFSCKWRLIRYKPWNVALSQMTQQETTVLVCHTQHHHSSVLHDHWQMVVYQQDCSHSAAVDSHAPTSSPVIRKHT